jgi:hypothetical protein
MTVVGTQEAAAILDVLEYRIVKKSKRTGL